MIPSPNLPDFSHPIQHPEYILFPAADVPNLYVHLPRTLEIASRDDAATPDFMLELVRGFSPFLPPKPYGLLDFRLRPAAFSVQALTDLRLANPQAVVAPAAMTRGWLRLKPTVGSEIDAGELDAAELAAPIELASNGLEMLRLFRRLSPDGISLLKQVLQKSLMTFVAQVEVEIQGLAPRLPVELTLQGVALLERLNGMARQQRITYPQLVDFWKQDAALLPVEFASDLAQVDRDLLAIALADWTIADYGVYTPCTGEPLQPTVLLHGQQPPQILRWNLAQRKVVHNVFLLDSDPFTMAQQTVSAQGIEALYHETIVPPVQTGAVSLSVATNLPSAIQGVLELGVNLFAPPRPPARVHALTASLQFDLQDAASLEAAQTVNWLFAPLEAVEFELSTFALAQTASGPQLLQGNSRPHAGTYLLLNVADFPLRFVSIRADASLLASASIVGNSSYPADNGSVVEHPFELTSSNPLVTLSIPLAHVEQAQVRLEARSLAADAQLPIGTFPAQSQRLSLFSLPTYGPHAIDIEVIFDQALPLLAFEFLAEEDAEHLEKAAPLAFTPAQTKGRWSYFATSPFRAGYRFRRLPNDGSVEDWSSLQSPFTPLRLLASVFV
ncbi:MAG: hypothetical protein IT328_14030 [Caldilineaceae bacterium]|nr:hypothetical protein [Caldilineaceae bacterium]